MQQSWSQFTSSRCSTSKSSKYKLLVLVSGRDVRTQTSVCCLSSGDPFSVLRKRGRDFQIQIWGKFIITLGRCLYCEFPTHCTYYPSQEPRADFVIRIHSKQLQYCHHSFSPTPVHAPPLRLASLATDWNRLRSFAFKLKLQLPQLQLCPQRMYVSTKRLALASASKTFVQRCRRLYLSEKVRWRF